MRARVHQGNRPASSVRSRVIARPTATMSGDGRPLEPARRAQLESRAGGGHDFGQVRLHTDARAAESAAALDARAYTVGRDIFFARGQYRPDTPQGERLLAHELAHTVQQTRPLPGVGSGVLSSPTDAAESEARGAAEAWSAGRGFQPQQRTGIAVQRDKHKSESSVGGGRKVFIEVGFTGRETEDEVRRTAASRGWIVEGSLHWNGRNWVGENVRRATGKEQAIAQAEEITGKLSDLGAGIGDGIDISSGFEEGKTYLPGHEGADEKPPESFRPSEGEGDKAGESKTGTGENTADQKKGGEELDTLTALASLILDPESLAKKETNTTGQSGPPIGSKSGFLSGWLAKVLVVAVAIWSVAGSAIKKALGKAKDGIKKVFGTLRDKFRLPGGASPVKSLPAALSAEERRLKDQLMKNHNYTEQEADELLRQAREAPEPPASPNASGTTRQRITPGAGNKKP